MRNKKTIGRALMMLTLFSYVWIGIPVLIFSAITSIIMVNDHRYTSIKNQEILFSWVALLGLNYPFSFLHPPLHQQTPTPR